MVFASLHGESLNIVILLLLTVHVVPARVHGEFVNNVSMFFI